MEELKFNGQARVEAGLDYDKLILEPSVAIKFEKGDLIELVALLFGQINGINAIDVVKAFKSFQILKEVEAFAVFENFISDLEAVKELKKPNVITVGQQEKVIETIGGANLSIYIPGDDFTVIEIDALLKAAGEFMEAMGMVYDSKEEPIYSSFWQKLRFLFKKEVTFEDFHRLSKKAKQALELKHVELPSAEQTLKLSEAAAALINATHGVDECVVRLGVVLLYKYKVEGGNKVFVKQLTVDQVMDFTKYPEKEKDLLYIRQLVGESNASGEAVDTAQDEPAIL